jgi:hypothetical protein
MIQVSLVLTTTMTAALTAFDEMPTVVTCDQLPIDWVILDRGVQFVRNLRQLSHDEDV